MQIFYVYIITNRYNNVLYVGMTNNIVRRTFEHKEKANKGFTAKYNCSKLVWFEEHSSSYEALSKEKSLKRWKRDWKIKLVEKENPEWKDLAQDW